MSFCMFLLSVRTFNHQQRVMTTWVVALFLQWKGVLGGFISASRFTITRWNLLLLQTILNINSLHVYHVRNLRDVMCGSFVGCFVRLVQ
jgi:hypothetical protein